MVRAVIRVPYTDDGAAAAPGPASFDDRPARQPGGRLMSKVPSLMFDMEDTTEEGAAAAAAAGLDDAAEGDVAQELAAALEPWGDQEYMLRLHVRIAREEAAKRGHPHLGVAELADTLRRLGYPVRMRTALGGGWGGACLRNLRHSFLAVTLPGAVEAEDGGVGGGAPQEVIVDPRFREQFEIAHSTPRYERVLAAVPLEAAAPRDRLHRAVELLCAEMARAFCAAATPLPPWRQTAAMLSKWCPRRSEDVDLNGGGGDAAAAAANNAAGYAASTAAAKLAAMGAPPPQRASPISEGVEGADAWSTVTDEAGFVRTASTGSSPSRDAAGGSLELRGAAAAAARAAHPAFLGIRAAMEAHNGRRNTWA
jgi:uncharacterized protein (TIGR01615 family)